MAKSKTQRGRPATVTTPEAKPRTQHGRPATVATPAAKTVVERTTELSEEVLQSVEHGQRAAIEAVRKFVDAVDHALSGEAVTPSKRQEIIDSAMGMADRLVQTQYDFIRKVVHSAGKSLSRPDGKK